MSAEIVNLAERRRAPNETTFLAHLERMREQAATLQDQLNELKLLIAVGEKMVGRSDTMSDEEFAALAAQIEGTSVT